MTIITKELLAMIKDQYHLHWEGTHGVIHWSRVYDNGMKLAGQKGVDSRVVQLFSVFHDSRRVNEHYDPDHGSRGTELAAALRKFCPLDDAAFELLTTACKLHTHTLNHDNITVQACFDADRLDLGRVGIHPDPDRLCTPLAKEQDTIGWAYQRSLFAIALPEHPFGLPDNAL